MTKNQEFQFLMVQLKGPVPSLPAEPRLVSIPYGTIKRLYDKPRASTKYMFQFLMVQLKASKALLKSKSFLFQFLMVQLKVRRARRISSSCSRFQFLMVQLKVNDFTY